MRMENSLTQSDVAKVIGVSTPQNISNVERGVSPIPFDHLEEWVSFIGANKNTVMKLLMNNYRKKVRKGLGL